MAAAQKIRPRHDCPSCHGSGEISDYVPAPFGSGMVRMPSYCRCVEEQMVDDGGDVELALGPDVQVENHGTIMLLRLHTESAQDWVREHVQDPRYFGTALACEPRYCPDVVAGMLADGLTVE